MKNIKPFDEFKSINEEIDNEEIDNKELIIKVKHLIKYLQDNYDSETEVYLDHDGWLNREIHAVDELDLIKKRGIFCKMYNGELMINN